MFTKDGSFQKVVFGTPEVIPLSTGDAGTYETLEKMRGLVHESITRPEVKEVAMRAIWNCPPSNPLCYSRGIYDYAKLRMRYVPDTFGVEEITAPWVHAKRILETGMSYGDCDDFSVFQSAMLNSIGVPTRFGVIATPKNGGKFDHVRVEANVLGRWLPMETTRARAKFGERFPELRSVYIEV